MAEAGLFVATHIRTSGEVRYLNGRQVCLPSKLDGRASGGDVLGGSGGSSEIGRRQAAHNLGIARDGIAVEFVLAWKMEAVGFTLPSVDKFGPLLMSLVDDLVGIGGGQKTLVEAELIFGLPVGYPAESSSLCRVP